MRLERHALNPLTARRAARLRARLRRIAVVATVLNVSLAQPAFALDPERDLAQYNIQTWSRQNGLPINGVNGIAQSQDGYLWLGSSSGLVRFDGVDFELFDLASAAGVKNGRVNGLTPARDGGLWVGLGQGFGHFDGREFSYRGADADGALEMLIQTVQETDEGTLWFAGENAAVRLSPSGEHEIVLSSAAGIAANVFSAHVDSRERVWFATAEQGVHVRGSDRTTKFPDPDLDRGIVRCIAEDLAGNIWIGGERGLYRYDADWGAREIFLAGEEVRALFVDRHGVVWIGTTGSGLFRYWNGMSRPFSRVDGLADTFVTSIAEDREGSLWVGTRSGLSQLSDVKFPTVPVADDAHGEEALTVAASQRGGVWIGSNHGVTYFDGRERTTFAAEAGLPHSHVKRIFEARDGDLYLVGGSSTLVIWSAGRVVATYEADNMVVGMAEDAEGVVVSVGDTLYRAGRDHFVPYTYRSDRTPEMLWILNLTMAPDGGIWVSTVNGIFRVDRGDFQHWSTEHGLEDPVVFGITLDDEGTVWATTRNGIARLKDDRVRMINRDDGLWANDIFAIVPDAFGFLWIDSDQGLFRVSREDLNRFADDREGQITCAVFNGSESVKPADKRTQERVACTSTDGRIWFPNSNGVLVVDPSSIPVNQVPPPVYVDRLQANGRAWTPGTRAVVPPGRGDLEFRFTALSFIAPRSIRYRHRLEGYDDTWIETQNRRIASYTNLKPGRYTFHVAAANADGIWNTDSHAQSVELRPHFHQTTWFLVLIVAFVILLLTGAYLARIQQLKAKERALQNSRRKLEAEVQNRTGELAGANASLRGEVEKHKQTAAQLEERGHALEKEIEERKRMQEQIGAIHKQLLQASRQAGMAEVATGVLHNVGNVLNSINVSATLVGDSVRKFEVGNLARVSALLQEHQPDLAAFFGGDPKAGRIPGFLDALTRHMSTSQESVLKEIEDLRNNIDHIKEIVAMQQSYARVSGVAEEVPVTELVEDAIRMNAGALIRHDVKLARDFQVTPVVTLEKHKVLQVLVNLIRNAKYACDESGRPDKLVTVRITGDDTKLRITVEDNGVGIPPENLTRIFSHGFTTRKDGHGFGLHSGALAARELGGTLNVSSGGPGQGAVFTLELPLAGDGTRAMTAAALTSA